MLLMCRSLGKIYRTRNGVTTALKDVSLSVGEQEFVCIVGPSGCGKTTLLKLIAGLLEPTSGRIIFGAGEKNGRLRSAMVFQEHGLFPWMTVLGNVAFGLEMQGISQHECRDRAHDFIEKVGLGFFTHSYPHELSVGMCQRVGIARAFVADSQILLMDEPVGSLDTQTRLVLQEELLRIWVEHRKSIIYVTHDIEEAIWLGDQVLVMTGRPGQIREEIQIPLRRPRNPLNSNRQEISEIKWHIWKILEEEVRKSLCIPT
ncbi:MAG: ABC transporter ATP-binding protein [Gemmatimonadota bacterium]|nr:MAG: ABC transporter ATP-binding protein [Gemmatimonadota bacterium]